MSSSSKTATPAAETCTKTINVLCLHGNRQNAASFRQYCKNVEKKASKSTAAKIHFHYLDAMYPMGEDDDPRAEVRPADTEIDRLGFRQPEFAAWSGQRRYRVDPEHVGGRHRAVGEGHVAERAEVPAAVALGLGDRDAGRVGRHQDDALALAGLDEDRNSLASGALAMRVFSPLITQSPSAFCVAVVATEIALPVSR